MHRLSYPKTRRDDVVEVLHAISAQDPYRWLEENTSEVLAWEAEQNSLTRSVLNEWPDLHKLREAIRAALTSDLVVHTPIVCGKFCFQVRHRPEDQRPVLWVKEEAIEAWRILLDPNAMPEGSALDWFYPSPNGEYVAYGISRHGDEQSVLYVIETRTGKVLPERIPHTSTARLTWLPDSSGFYYSGGKASDLEDAWKWLFFHKVGETAIEKPDSMKFDAPWIAPQLSPDGRYLMIIEVWDSPRAVYCKDLAEGGEWRPAMQGKPGSSFGEFVGDSYLALTTYQAPRGRIVSIPLATAQDASTWTELVPESEAVLSSFVRVDGNLVISELHNAYARLRIVSMNGTVEELVPLPGMGRIEGMTGSNTSQFSVEDHNVYFTFETFTAPPRIYKYSLDSRTLEPQGPAPSADLSHLETRQVFYTSKDGTRVSMFLVYRRNLDLSHPNPTLLHGYGGWNIVPAPGYVRCVLPFIEAGGIYAFANLRGGAEYGRDWWQAGCLETKQNTFDDLYAAAEYLIELGMTTRDLLAIMGASNGGLLTAAAVTQRPDLFKAVVSQVPLTDMVRAIKDPYVAAYVTEYGDPRDAEMLPVLLAYSPIHNVREGERYPATLVQCGDSDIRCPPWHGRKLVAFMQHATVSDAPVLLKVDHGMGHGVNMSVHKMVERSTTALGFIMQQLGMTVAGKGV